MPGQKTALLIVDVQRDLASPGGVRYDARAQAILKPLLRLREGARRKGWPILYTQVVRDKGEALPKGGKGWCVRGTRGVEIIPECTPSPAEVVVSKRTLDGFFGTDLDLRLRRLGVGRLVIAGMYANEGVLLTAGEAALRWYDIVLAADAVAARTDFDYQATLREISFLYRGRLTTVDSLLAGRGRAVEPDLSLSPPPVRRRRSVRRRARETALVVVDMQNDFARKGGSLFVPEAAGTVGAIRRLLGRARAKGVLTVFTQDWHRPDDAEFRIWPVHAVEGTPGAEVIRPLGVREDEVRVRKLRYDAFYGTSLDHLLRLHGVRDVVVVGTVSNICVLHTAGKAALHGYRVAVAEDGISSLAPFDQALALRQITEVFSGEVCASAGITFA